MSLNLIATDRIPPLAAGLVLAAAVPVWLAAADAGRIAPWWARLRLVATALFAFPILALLVTISVTGAP